MDHSDPIPAPVAHAIADEVSRVPGVARLHPGDYGEVALLFPGERVPGLRLLGRHLQVHLVIDLDALGPTADLAVVAEHVRGAARSHTDLPVDVILADAIYRDPNGARTAASPHPEPSPTPMPPAPSPLEE